MGVTKDLKGRKIRIAFIKFGGLSAGGTEKFLQTLAANLDKNRFSVDYYYSDSAPYVGDSYIHANTDPNRLKYMLDHGINLVKFEVSAKDVSIKTHDWLGTDFWEKFHESDYDLIQTARAGHPEYPFCFIKKTPIIDSIHFLGGVDNQYNISRVLHISRWSADKWVKMGGDKSRVRIISHPMEINYDGGDFRKELNLENKFIFGFHQRGDNGIFSPFPLSAYAAIQSDKNYFIVMGGGSVYRDQARELGLKNIFFLPHSGDPKIIYKFLSTLNVFAHGRKDGEINSTALAEAMYFGLPIVSHHSLINEGHVEFIGDCGLVVNDVGGYSREMSRLQNDSGYYNFRSKQAKINFSSYYDLKKQVSRIEQIYEDTLKNPFPNKCLRRVESFVNNLKVFLYRRRFLIRIFRYLKKYGN